MGGVSWGASPEPSNLLGIAPCFTCGQPFAFDPDRVVSVPIDPVTGLPPDAPGANPQGDYVRRPICPGCCQAMNPERARRGLALLDTTDTGAQEYGRRLDILTTFLGPDDGQG
jgi:hypothetical protein